MRNRVEAGYTHGAIPDTPQTTGGAEIEPSRNLIASAATKHPNVLSAARLFNAWVVSQPTVTEALQSWCARYGVGSGPLRARVKVRYRDVSTEQTAPAAPETFAARVTAPVAYRQVALMRGAIRVCDAEIWYDTSALTPDMREALAQTEQPFGAIVATLQPYRQALHESVCDDTSRFGVEHAALLYAGDGRLLAQTREVFLAPLFAVDV